MGPIEKKIKEYINLQGISEDTIAVLNNLVDEVKPIEKNLVNKSYAQGYFDKEKGKSATWDHYSSKFISYTFLKV